MPSLLLEDEGKVRNVPTLASRTLSLFLHTLLALACWVALMAAGYALNPQNLSQNLILLISFAVPLLVGAIVNRFKQAEMATGVWVLGFIWFAVMALWIIGMPTAPDQCLQCSLGEKVSRTFFSFPSPSGLIDDDGPFLVTWPAAALIGYSIGARLMRRRRRTET